MDLTTTLTAMGATLIAIGLVWRDMRRPWRPGRWRIVSPEFVQFLLILLLLMLLGHLATLLSGGRPPVFGAGPTGPAG